MSDINEISEVALQIDRAKSRGTHSDDALYVAFENNRPQVVVAKEWLNKEVDLLRVETAEDSSFQSFLDDLFGKKS